MSTLPEILARYLADATNVAESTRRTCRYVCNAWGKRTGIAVAERIDEAAIVRFRAACVADHLSPHTIERWIDYLCLMLRTSGFNPSVGRRLALPEPDPTMPTLEEFGQVYEAAKYVDRPRLCRCDPGHYVQALLAVGLWTGLRLSDWFSLEWSDVTESVITKRATKTSKVHKFPMCSVVRRHLDRLPKRPGPIFPVWAPCPTRLREMLARLCDDVKVKQFTPQEVRRLSINTWTDANPCAGAIIQGASLGRGSALPWYLAKDKPLKVLEKAAPAFVWPDEMLTDSERDKRQSGEAELLTLTRRLSSERMADLRRVALAFAE